MTLAERYAATFPLSRDRFERAKRLFPTGVTHDARMMSPFPVYISHLKGSKKWSVEGIELVDYFVGHGSHLLGHSPDDVVQAVQAQMARGTHAGACHDLELEWAECVQALMPGAERLRFTGSGTEATMMALRLARLHTGKPKFLRFHGHFHGWHDAVTIAADPPYESTAVPGVSPSLAEQAVAIPPNDANRVDDALARDPQIGAIILEPTGGHWGAVPIRGEFLRQLREIATRRNAVLIFDEVITGFRVSPGGAQCHYGVTPDLTTLAKILAGGLPGGCVVGRQHILAHLEPHPQRPKMRHPGTYNANPLSASAGIATLKRIASTDACAKANATARSLRNGFNAMFAANRFPWIAYGDFSMIHIRPGYDGPAVPAMVGDTDGPIPFGGDPNVLDGPKPPALVQALRQGMLLNGVDWWAFAGMTSCEHSEADVAKTVAALEATIGEIASPE